MGKIRHRYSSIHFFFAVYILSLFVSAVIYTFYLEAIETQTVLRHKVILRVLDKSLVSANGVPTDISNIAGLESLDEEERMDVTSAVNYEQKKHSLEYYPDSWNKPGKILLKSYLFNRQVVTFGDGYGGIVSRWFNRPKDESFGSGESNVFFFSSFLVVPPIIFWLIIIALGLVQKACDCKKRKLEQDRPAV